jgi:uncharacterized protein YjeT (DUF2065 family)
VGIWTLLFLALGMAMFLEGLPYFASPGSVRRYLQILLGMGDRGLRLMGICLMVAGLLVAYLATR